MIFIAIFISRVTDKYLASFGSDYSCFSGAVIRRGPIKSPDTHTHTMASDDKLQMVQSSHYCRTVFLGLFFSQPHLQGFTAAAAAAAAAAVRCRRRRRQLHNTTPRTTRFSCTDSLLLKCFQNVPFSRWLPAISHHVRVARRLQLFVVYVARAPRHSPFVGASVH